MARHLARKQPIELDRVGRFDAALRSSQSNGFLCENRDRARSCWFLKADGGESGREMEGQLGRPIDLHLATNFVKIVLHQPPFP